MTEILNRKMVRSVNKLEQVVRIFVILYLTKNDVDQYLKKKKINKFIINLNVRTNDTLIIINPYKPYTDNIDNH